MVSYFIKSGTQPGRKIKKKIVGSFKSATIALKDIGIIRSVAAIIYKPSIPPIQKHGHFNA